jgi:hypothetical protein
MQKKRMFFALAFALAGSALVASAQEMKERKPAPSAQMEQNIVIERQQTMAQKEGSGEMGGDTFVFVSSEMSIDSKIVKGAPYSAQSVTETVQTLGDGNRIVRKNTAQVYRDSEGRTRRDQTLGSIGPFAVNGDPPQTFLINDPVAGVNYILDPRTKTARKLPRLEFQFRTENKESAGTEKEKSIRREPKDGEAHSFVFTTPVPPPPDMPGPPPEVEFYASSSKADTKTEKLEARNVEGVQAEGFRTVTTIPTGEIGNEQPIQIVHERWFSPELQAVVMTRHSDPRFGETTYRLTNITRTEPASTLFQVPPDYTVKEGPAFGTHTVRRMKRPGAPPENQ